MLGQNAGAKPRDAGCGEDKNHDETGDGQLEDAH
jgi:hypothetical protein